VRRTGLNSIAFAQLAEATPAQAPRQM